MTDYTRTALAHVDAMGRTRYDGLAWPKAVHRALRWAESLNEPYKTVALDLIGACIRQRELEKKRRRP